MSRRFYTGDQVTIDFMKDFDRLCGARTRWQVWSDWVHLAAYSISNVVDKVHAEEREKSYLKIASGYSKAELTLISHLLAYTVEALELNPDQDFLGALYMNLDLGNDHAGQFFTPYNVSKMMAEMNFTHDGKLKFQGQKRYASVCDPTVGGGGMLVAFANACRAHNVYYHTDIMFVGQDIDHTVACMAYIQISLLGCPGYIVVGDSLSKPMTGDPLFAPMDGEVLITPFYYSEVWEYRRIARMLGLNPVETCGESDPASGNIETYPDEENAPEPVATQETHEETHACVSETETNTSSCVGEDINVPTKEPDSYLQLTFF